jgi:hypothetical protein
MLQPMSWRSTGKAEGEKIRLMLTASAEVTVANAYREAQKIAAG